MNILINRTNTENKGAELMLYAVLKELERIHPDANVILPYTGFEEGLSYIQTSIKLLFRKGKWLYDILDKSYLLRIGKKLSLPLLYFTDMHAVKNINYFIDAGGFQFSDQIGYRINTPKRWEKILSTYKKQGTKIIFLPQAFGPFKKEIGKNLMRIICKYSDLVFARDEISYQYLMECGINRNNIYIAPDFTLFVHGYCPKQYEHLKNGVAIIPNLRMVDKGIVAYNEYIKVMENLINQCKKAGHQAFLLNHEGKDDEKLCLRIVEELTDRIEIVTGLNALEVKGVIENCYAVISSRFHGVASALSQAVPVLATSWSHKYELLFKDYKIKDAIINIGDESYLQKLSMILDEKANVKYRELLHKSHATITNQITDMWKCVWNI